jgi:small subunit ribosomal protein S13
MVENLIVRVIGKDLDGTKTIEDSLRGIKGIGQRVGRVISNKFCKENNIDKNTKLGDLKTEDVKKLEAIVSDPSTAGLPAWALNRQKDYETGEDKHLTMNDLDFQLRNDFGRLAEIKSYRGLRHSWGLTVRGQRTRSTHRGKGGSVGVAKKDAKK